MKHTKFFIFALVAAMTFSACGTDDSLEITKTDQGNGSNNGGENTGGGSGGSTGGESTDKYNTNKNVATVNMPEVARNAIGGLEFPKLKNNGTSLILQMIQHRRHSTWTMDISVQMQTDYIMQINAIKHII